MVQKRILSPDEVGELAPHWYELDPDKLRRITTRSTRRVKIHGTGQVGDVLDVTPILVYSPQQIGEQKFGKRDIILNGKHRAGISYVRESSLAAVVVRTAAEIRNHVKQACFGDLDADSFVAIIDDHQKYLSIVNANGTPTIKAMVEKFRHLFI